MPARDDFVDHCMDLLAPAGPVRAKRMFGGHGLYVDDVFVAIITDDTLYLKADEATRPQFEAAGGRRFEYTRQGKQQGTGYWTPPEEAMDSPALMRPWTQLAIDAALRARSGTRGRRKA